MQFLLICLFLFTQTHHTIMTQLLQSSVRLLDCPWLQQQQRSLVETCIKTLAMTGESERETDRQTDVQLFSALTSPPPPPPPIFLQPRVAPSLFLWTWSLTSAPCCRVLRSTLCPAPTQTTSPCLAPQEPLLPATPGTIRISSKSYR